MNLHVRRRTFAAAQSGDGGLTLIELIVSLLVGTLVLGGLAVIFANALVNDMRTRERDSATGMAHVITNSIQASVRNSAGPPVVSNGGMVLRARVATGASGWECRAWAVSSGELRYFATPGAIDAGTSGSADGWRTLATGVVGTGPAGEAFVMDGARGLTLHIAVTVGASTVPLTGGVAAQGAGSDDGGGSAACVA
jgi:type II secretory pathway pseudopilin PulG